MKLPPVTMRFEYDWQLAQVRAIQREAAIWVLEKAIDLCSDEYRTPDGWGTTSADSRCVGLLRTLKEQIE